MKPLFDRFPVQVHVPEIAGPMRKMRVTVSAEGGRAWLISQVGEVFATFENATVAHEAGSVWRISDGDAWWLVDNDTGGCSCKAGASAMVVRKLLDEIDA